MVRLSSMDLSLHSGFDIRGLSLLLSLVVDLAAVAMWTRAFRLVNERG